MTTAPEARNLVTAAGSKGSPIASTRSALGSP
jgi:hypothetical protein